MDVQTYQIMLQKYLDNFILPKYEDILSYRMRLVEYKFRDKFLFEIRFFMDGTGESGYNEISDDLVQGLFLLGINKEVIFDAFFDTEFG